MAKSRSSSSKSGKSRTKSRGARSGGARSKSSARKSSTRGKSTARRSSASRSSATRSRTARTSATASRSKSAGGKRSGSKSTRGGGSSAGSKTTTDHDQIRQWAEARGGRPACVRGTGGGGDTGLLRIDFPGYSGADSLQEISWEEFFEKFDQQNLALLYQETTSGGQRSNFNKLVSRDDAGNQGKSGRGR